MFRSLVIIAAFAMLAGPAWSQKKVQPSSKPPAEAFKELLPNFSLADDAKRYDAQQKWQAICFRAGAPGNETLRVEVCKLMLPNLAEATPVRTRLWLLKQLEFLGREESVDAVAAALLAKEFEVVEAAARALANSPAKAATQKLVDRLSAESEARAKVALLNALGFRADAAASQAIAKELAGAPQVAQAAARALGRMPGAETAKLLSDARASAKDPVRSWICDAYLACADRLVKDGKYSEAAVIYKELYEGEKSRPIRLAALSGVFRTAGDDAGPAILSALAGMDDDAREIALAQIESVSPKSLQTLAAGIEKLPPNGQVLLLGALAARGEKSQRAVVLTAAQSKNEAIQKAGVRALGRVGDVSAVPFLIETAFLSGKSAAAAKESLLQISGEGVDERILAAFKAEKVAGKRVGLIAILEGRRVPAAVPVLIEEASGDDAAIRAVAMTALRKLAEPKDVPAIIPAILKTKPGSERLEAEKTIVTILARIPEPEKRADVLLPLLSAETRIVLLPVVGGVGGPKALEPVRSALAGKDDERRAGIQALANWPDHTVSADLLAIAKSGASDDEKARALRGVIRINSLSNEHPAAPRLENLKKAIELAGNPADKKSAIEALGTAKDVESLRAAVPFLADKDFNQAACKAVVELAHSKTLREPNVQEFHKALDQVLTICRDKGLIERAKKYKAGG